MNGLYKLFLKLTPIMLLICCICFGITHTFQQAGSNTNLTYLYTEEINIGTEEQPENKTLYRFDVKSYAQNIDQDILKRSVTKTINLADYQKTLNRFNELWKDGYQFGDGIQTIVNGLILVVNTIILPINIILVPVRVISGFLLTGMSLVGININNGQIICPMLNFFVDKLAIPFIQPSYNEAEDPQHLKGTTWLYNNTLQYMNHGGTETYTMSILFDEANGTGKYQAVKITFNENNQTVTQMEYQDLNGYWIIVYTQNNGWLYQTSKQIYIRTDNNFYDYTGLFGAWIRLNATEQNY